jgi:transposase
MAPTPGVLIAARAVQGLGAAILAPATLTINRRHALSVEDWAEIRRLHRSERMPIRAIARKMGVGRNTMRRALKAEGPPKYVRKAKGSIVDAVEPQIRELLGQWPDMPATVIAERIGWSRSMTVLKERIRELRPLFVPPDPSSRTSYQPGERAQCDLWFPPVDVPLGFGQLRPPVLGQRVRDRAVAGRPAATDHRDERLPRQPGHQGHPVPPRRS